MNDPFDNNINVEQTDRHVTCDEGKLTESLVKQIREMQKENQKLSESKHPFFRTVTWFILGILTKLTEFVNNYQKNQFEAEKIWFEYNTEQRRDYLEFILAVADRTDCI